MEAQYLQQVRAVCEYCGNDWHRVYLLRALNRLSGMNCILSLMNDPAWRWVFPAELLRLQVCQSQDFLSWGRAKIRVKKTQKQNTFELLALLCVFFKNDIEILFAISIFLIVFHSYYHSKADNIAIAFLETKQTKSPAANRQSKSQS